MAATRRLATLVALAGSWITVAGVSAQEAAISPPGRPPIHIIIPPARPFPSQQQPVTLTSVGVDIDLADQVCTTTLDLALTNPQDRPQEAQLILPVPDGVVIRSLQWDGTGVEPNAQVLPREEARRIYESIVRSQKDPALVEFVGMNLIQSSVFPVPPRATQHLRLTYEQVLPRDGNRLDYTLIRSEALGASGVAWSITANLRSKQPIATVYSSSHDITQERTGPGHVRVRLAGPQALADRGSFRLSALLEAQPGDLATSVFLYPSQDVSPEGGGYFLILAAPPSMDRREMPASLREVILVIDRSGSMRGEKIEQTRNAASQIIKGLRDGEYFNIIDYSDSIASFAPAPVAKTAESGKQAEAYIRSLQANGGTNIHDAMLEGLRAEPRAGAVPLMLFMTDGLPTVGERSEHKIRDAVRAANRKDAQARRIFSFGVGFDVNAPLLASIANGARGATTLVLPEEDVEVKVSQVFRRLDGPVMSVPTLAAIGADGQPTTRRLREQFPAELPDVFEGDQVLVLGQYVGKDPVRVRIEGDYFGRPRSFDVTIDPANATTRHNFVPRLWANRKITALIDEVRQAGADGQKPNESRMRELTDEIVRLSTAWGILTEYTAFLAREETVFTGGAPALRAPAEANLERRALRVRSGGGGAAQQMDLSTKQAASNLAAKPEWIDTDADGQIVRRSVENVQYVAGRAYFNRKNVWIESQLLEHEALAPDREIAFASDEYFRLAESLAKEGRQAVLAQQGDVLLQVGKDRVLVRSQ